MTLEELQKLSDEEFRMIVFDNIIKINSLDKSISELKDSIKEHNDKFNNNEEL